MACTFWFRACELHWKQSGQTKRNAKVGKGKNEKEKSQKTEQDIDEITLTEKWAKLQ